MIITVTAGWKTPPMVRILMSQCFLIVISSCLVLMYVSSIRFFDTLLIKFMISIHNDSRPFRLYSEAHWLESINNKQITSAKHPDTLHAQVLSEPKHTNHNFIPYKSHGNHWVSCYFIKCNNYSISFLHSENVSKH